MGEDKRGQQDRAGFRVPTIGSPVPRGHPGCGGAWPVRAAPPGSRHPVPLHSLLVVMQAQRAPYVPSSLEIVRIPGGAVLRIGYPVPSPLGLLRSGG